MKKSFLLFFGILFFSISAQTYVIPKSSGELLGFQTLWDKEKIYGYIEIHKGEIKDKIQNFNFVVLNPELQKISEGTFTQKKITQDVTHLGNCIYNNGKILINLNEYVFGKLVYMNDSFLIADVATGKTTESKIFQNKNLIATKDFKIENPSFVVLNYGLRTTNVENVGFLINEVEKRGSIGFYKNAVLINFEGEKIWENAELSIESKDNFYEYTPFSSDEDVVCLFVEYYKKRKSISDNILVLNSKTGEKLFFKPIAEKDFLLNYEEAKIVGDKIYLVGEYFKKNQNPNDNSPALENKLGLYRYIINKKTGEFISKNFLPFNAMSSFVDINENGRIKKEGVLMIKSFEIRPDESNVIIAETYRPEAILAVNAYTELFSILLNNDFKIEKMQSYNVNNTAASKYAYTQLLNDNSGLSSVFFNNEINEERIIFLNEIVYKDADKSFETKTMQVEKSDEEKYFFPAKTGFVVLKQDFGKSKKNEKTSEITLKKIEAK